MSDPLNGINIDELPMLSWPEIHARFMQSPVHNALAERCGFAWKTLTIHDLKTVPVGALSHDGMSKIA